MKKDFSKYYTPEAIASVLVELLDIADNSKVIDICCGSGNLLHAAQKINNTITCQGVDISEPVDRINRSRVVCDGREYAVKHMGEYDIALANPPFGLSPSNLYKDLLFRNEYKALPNGRLEIEMLIANLLILNDRGTLLIILPSTVVTGVSMINVRKVIAKKHSLFSIIDLPNNAFAPEKIKCSALIIKKPPNICRKTKIFKLDESFALHEMREIDLIDVLEGNWSEKAQVYNDMKLAIHQGTISSQMFCEEGVEILHTGKKTSNWQPSIRHTTVPNNKKCIVAEPGDILISRIGTSAGQKCIYQGPPRYISDCLLIIKSPPTPIATQIMDMDFFSLVSGLSTPHITANSIMRFLMSHLQHE